MSTSFSYEWRDLVCWVYFSRYEQKYEIKSFFQSLKLDRSLSRVRRYHHKNTHPHRQSGILKSQPQSRPRITRTARARRDLHPRLTPRETASFVQAVSKLPSTTWVSPSETAAKKLSSDGPATRKRPVAIRPNAGDLEYSNLTRSNERRGEVEARLGEYEVAEGAGSRPAHREDFSRYPRRPADYQRWGFWPLPIAWPRLRYTGLFRLRAVVLGCFVYNLFACVFVLAWVMPWG